MVATKPKMGEDLVRPRYPARTRVLAATVVGVIVGGVVGLVSLKAEAPLVGWIAAAALFVGWTWVDIWPRDSVATASHAQWEDPSRPFADAACTTAAIASLVAVGIVLVHAASASGATKSLEIALAIGSVVTSWFLIHTVFTLKYARIYYGTRQRPVDFNNNEGPAYSDFAYMAFTIGLTFQVSDTDLRTNELRRVALRHMLLSYLMGAVIIALSINLVAGMTK